MEYNIIGLLAILFRNTDFYPAVMRNRVGQTTLAVLRKVILNWLHCTQHSDANELVILLKKTLYKYRWISRKFSVANKILPQKFEKMRWLIFLLFVGVNLLAFTEADPQFENPYYYQNYPVAYQNPEYNPYLLETPTFGKENRIFWSLTTLFLTTTTKTTTTTTTCTVSTSSVCSGRRKRFLYDALRGEDDNIEPSPVNKWVLASITGVIEVLIDWSNVRFVTTEHISIERKAREAKPQFNNFWGVIGDYPSYGIQPTFGSRYYPIYNQQMPFARNQQIAPEQDSRLFFGKITITTTSTSTTTSSSTPSCSTTSSYSQC